MADRDETIEQPSLARRTVLTAASGGLLAVASNAAGLGRLAVAAQAPAGGAGLVATALECAGSGEVCLNHCLREFAQGQTTLAACAARVSEMVPVCDTLASLAALQSKHLAAYAKVCIDVCKSCEEECRKHEQHHTVCKDCADACAKVIEACQKVV